MIFPRRNHPNFFQPKTKSPLAPTKQTSGLVELALAASGQASTLSKHKRTPDGAFSTSFFTMKKFFNLTFAALAIFLVGFSPTKIHGQIANVYGTAAMNESFGEVLALGTSYYTTGHHLAPNPTTYSAQITSIKSTAIGTINWVKELCGPAGESLNLSDIKESVSGNLIVVGNVFPGVNSSANNRYFVAEVHAITGAVLQSKIIARSGSFRQLRPRITKVTDCNVACGGAYIVTSWVDNGSPDNVFAMKLDYGLNVVWANDYEAGGDDEPYGIIATPGGGAIISGHSSTNGWQNFLLELDCNGNIGPCTKGLKPTAGWVFLNGGIARALNGDILLCGAAQPPGTDRRATACRVNPCGIPVWSKIWHGVPNVANPEMMWTSIGQLNKTNGNVYAAGFVDNGTGFEPRITKYAFASGATNFYNDFGGVGGGVGGGLGLVGTATKVVLAAYKTVPAPPGFGLLEGFLTHQGANLDACDPKTAIALPNMPLAVTQMQWTTSPVQLTVTPHCCNANLTWQSADVCSISNKPAGKERTGKNSISEPSDFEIHPNPANDVLEIIFSNEETARGQSIQIFDFTGKLVKTQPMTEGTTESSVDIADLPKGVYLVKIGDGEGKKMTKM